MTDEATLRIVLEDDGGPAPGRPAPEGHEQPRVQESPSAKKAGAEAAEGEEGGAVEGAEGAEAAGAGAEAAALGPIAAVAAVVIVGAKVLAATFDAVSATARTAAAALTSLAGNDNGRGLTATADAAAEALGKIPIAGAPLESGIKALTSTFTAVNDVADAFVQRGRQLQGYSADLSAANAQADVRSLLADIREASDLGPELARLTDAESRASVELREILLPLKEYVIGRLADIMEFMAENAGAVKAAAEAEGQEISLIGKILANALGFNGPGGLLQVPEMLLKLPGDFRAIMDKAIDDFRVKAKADKENDDKIPDLAAALLNQNGIGAFGNADPVRQAAFGQLNAPLFGD